MKDKGTEIPGMLLTAEPERKGPWIAYWIGAALSFGFWLGVCFEPPGEPLSFGAELGLFVLALFLGGTSWLGVGLAIAWIVLSFMPGFGI